MAILRVERLDELFVIHFEAERRQINAYTLASAIVAVADAAKAANAEINPGYEVEVVVEATASGSFRAALRAIYKKAGNLFSESNVKNVVLGVIACYVYDHTLNRNAGVRVTVETNEVIIVSLVGSAGTPADHFPTRPRFSASTNGPQGTADPTKLDEEFVQKM